MNKELIELFNSFESPKEFGDYIYKHYNYALLDKNNNELTNESSSYKKYSLQSPERFLKNMKGICWDLTEFERAFFEYKKYDFTTYFIVYENDKKGYPSHSILIFKNGNSYCWFENWKSNFGGMHSYLTKELALLEFYNQFVKMHNIKKTHFEDDVYLYEYSKPEYEITSEELYNHCQEFLAVNEYQLSNLLKNTSIEINSEEKINENTI